MDNAVNNVVANLIRAAAGSSAKSVSDQDVDKFVADLILKEAEEKRKKYNQVGVQAYKPSGLPNKPKPKPNTRFLLNMVKATDSHNQAVIKANEDNVAKLREERLERERLLTKEKKHRESRRRHRHEDDKDRRSSHRRRSSSSSSSHSNHKEERKRSHRDDRGNSRDHSQDKKSRHSSSSSKEEVTADRIDPESLKRTTSPVKQDVQYKGRGKVRINVSSMDKYFSEGYDPSMDVDSDKEEYVFATENQSKRKHKKHNESKKKKKIPVSLL
ncbi:uncharacterized protein EV154DRAFT_58988 [Mucor mucedo]|uniref:uncharacterized protein n=1 Tax=Mucor mucedo TaxID=29922 RepID=UPI0022200988|nr:uncharacterized protein EV154DRAFT_58988 [Mucor mucedo]KAI7894843.1 hypothetical protein EV154DRAFT_58988 [Mucor mucedo]